jgi:hypothetical protein
MKIINSRWSEVQTEALNKLQINERIQGLGPCLGHSIKFATNTSSSVSQPTASSWFVVPSSFSRLLIRHSYDVISSACSIELNCCISFPLISSIFLRLRVLCFYALYTHSLYMMLSPVSSSVKSLLTLVLTSHNLT